MLAASHVSNAAAALDNGRLQNAAASLLSAHYQSEGFMQWFLKEQTEEVATMSDLLVVAQRNADDPENIEEYLARERPDAEAEDPTAPPVAGGAV